LSLPPSSWRYRPTPTRRWRRRQGTSSTCGLRGKTLNLCRAHNSVYGHCLPKPGVRATHPANVPDRDEVPNLPASLRDPRFRGRYRGAFYSLDFRHRICYGARARTGSAKRPGRKSGVGRPTLGRWCLLNGPAYGGERAGGRDSASTPPAPGRSSPATGYRASHVPSPRSSCRWATVMANPHRTPPARALLHVLRASFPWRSDPSAGNGFGMHPSTRCNSAAQRPCRSLRTLRAPGGALWVDHVGVDDLGEGGFVDVGEGLLQGPACSRLHALGVVGHGLLLPCRALGHGSSRSAEEARDLNLPVESGVRDGRNALVRSVVLFEEVLP
jgi:hypothetical protein